MSSYRPRSLLSQCPRCLRYRPLPRRRLISTHKSNPPLPPHSGYALLPNRRLISLHGQDAYRFLQGLVTSNIPPQSSSHGHYSAFLNAQGRVLYDVFIYPATHDQYYRDTVTQGLDEPGLIIEVDANETENVVKHLKRYKLGAKVGIRSLEPEEWGVWSVWPRKIQSLEQGNGIWSSDDRAPEMGQRIIRRREKPPEGDGEVSSEQYDLRRMLQGVAEGQSDIPKAVALPQESNIDYMGGIDFRKGCYIGQELTIRTHHTGVVRKRVLPVQLYESEETKPPDELRYDPNSTLVTLPSSDANISRVDKKGRSAGKWLGGVGDVGLALCRLEVMTDTALTSEGSQWNPEARFQIAWGSEGEAGGPVNVKAFVPKWHAMRAEVQSPRGNNKS